MKVKCDIYLIQLKITIVCFLTFHADNCSIKPGGRDTWKGSPWGKPVW